MYQIVASYKTQNKIPNISHILALSKQFQLSTNISSKCIFIFAKCKIYYLLEKQKSVLNLVCQITPQKCKQSRKYVTMLHNQGKLRKTTCDFCWNLRCRKTLNNYCNLISNRISDMPFIDASNLKLKNQHHFPKLCKNAIHNTKIFAKINFRMSILSNR